MVIGVSTSVSPAQRPGHPSTAPLPSAGVEADAAPGSKKENGVVTRFVMRGTIPRNKLKPFVFLVRSLCPETGQIPEFREYDRVYNPSPEARGALRNSIRLRTRLPATRSPSPAPGPPPSSASASAPASSTGTNATADAGGSGSSISTISATGQWLLYAGPPSRRAPGGIDQRPVTTVAVRDAEPLLTILGCTLAFEYVRKVIRYKTRAGLYIDVFLIERLITPGDPSSTVALPQASHDPREHHCVVELWADDLISLEPLTKFAKYLSPYVASFSHQ